jgi:hypothetical protein
MGTFTTTNTALVGEHVMYILIALTLSIVDLKTYEKEVIGRYETIEHCMLVKRLMTTGAFFEPDLECVKED